MTVINVEVTVAPTNKLPHGTVRRAPAPSFAHAILLDQMGREQCWQVIDLYGPMEIETDVDVQDWPIVYIPAPDETWREVVPPIPFENLPLQKAVRPGEALPFALKPCQACGHIRSRHLQSVGVCGGCEQNCTTFSSEVTHER